MRDPFEQQKKSRGWSRLLDFDSWIDSSMFSMFSGAGETWESITIFFRRFRVTGFKKFLVEILDEGITLGLLGSIVMLMLALPAFDETEKNWRDQADFAVVFQDRYGKKIGERGNSPRRFDGNRHPARSFHQSRSGYRGPTIL